MENYFDRAALDGWALIVWKHDAQPAATSEGRNTIKVFSRWIIYDRKRKYNINKMSIISISAFTKP